MIGFDLKPCQQAPAHAVLELVEAACQPALAGQIVTALTRCWSVTKAREHDEIDLEMTLVAMAEGLAEFPIDVIRDACLSWAKCEKWRPSLAELRDYCWARFRARDSLRRALRAA